MKTQKIPYSDWLESLNQFSRAHHGQEVKVQTFDPETGIRGNLEGVPLLGVNVEKKQDQSRTITIEAGAPERGSFAHTVELPIEIRVAEWNDGVSAVLDIESADEQITRVQVGPSEQLLAPGMVLDDVWQRE